MPRAHACGAQQKRAGGRLSLPPYRRVSKQVSNLVVSKEVRTEISKQVSKRASE